MKQTVEQIKNKLTKFTGSIQLYYNLTSNKIKYTEGIKYLCEICNSDFLLKEILLKIEEFIDENNFIVVKVFREKGKNELKVKYEDKKENLIHIKIYDDLYFPLYNEKFEPSVIMFYENGVLHLPTEKLF